jgi:F-type H+-transporting ATPase subunit b
MEQLFGAFGIDGKLLIAQLINFGVLFVGLTYLLYKPVMKTLDARREKVAQGVVDADQAALKLATAGTEASTIVKGAESDAEGIVASARDAATAEKTRILKEAETRAHALEADAEARATETASKALRDSEKEIARLSVLAAEKVLRETA